MRARTLPHLLVLLSLIVGLAWPTQAHATFDNSVPRGTFAGTHNYTVIGNTLRTQPNSGNACALGATSSATLTIPVGSTVAAAYLYWGGSGPTPDTQVTFAGNAVTADEMFTDNFTVAGTYDLDYFGGFEDVTSLVTGNGTYAFGGLTVANTDDVGGNTEADYCAVQAVVAAWSLVVVYTNPAERYRFTRVYDGLQYFRGSSVTTTQSGFRVPDLVDGKVTTITWEGDPDPATSFELDFFNEALSFDGFPLINSGCDATNNLYNSTTGYPSGACSTTSYGADIDTYDVTPFLYEGQTGATLQYSSGNDLVLLTAQVISTTNTPVADLGIDKSHAGNFTAGQNGSFSIVVHNYGPEIATGTTTVTDTLPAGLTYVSGTGTGWSCAAVGQVVTCNHNSASVAVGADLPTLTITVAVGASAASSVNNVATVSHPMFDGTGGNQSDTDAVTVLKSNLSTSAKTVLDVNGGDANPGDVLRYTITLNETGGQGVAATGVQVVDDLPLKVGSLSVVSTPAGSTNQSVGSGGANGTGQVKVTGITVPAGGSATIVFDVTIGGTAASGEVITNSATITNASGTGATPSVNTTVSASQGPATGNKVLYLYDNLQLTRTPQVTNTTGASIGGDSNQTWVLTSVIPTGKSLQLPAQTVTVRLITTASGGGPARTLSATLLNDATAITPTGAVNTCSVSGTNQVCTISIPIPATTIPAGGTLRLRLSNASGKADRLVLIPQKTAGQGASTITFSSNTVVNVDTVAFYSAVYPATTQKTTWAAGETVYVRASISDPFGGYDVSAARLTFTDPNATVRVNNLAMTAMTTPTNAVGQSASRVFEYAYVLPASPPYGNWVAAVTGVEGTETPSVTHVRNGIFTLQPNALTIVKSHAGNFIAGTNGAYTLTVNNTGGGTVSGTTTVTDTLATGLTYVSGTGTGWTCGVAGQVVTCTSSTAIPASSSMAPITLTVAVAGNMGNSVDNKAAVGNSTIGGGFMTDGNTDTATILHPNLSTSTKTVQDLDGGDAEPGDTLRYTITLKESAGVAAANLSVSDTITGNLENFAVNAGLTTCNGTDASTSSLLSRSGISLAASAQCVIVFDATVSQFAGAGLEINNTATITNPAGPGATPAAPAVTVSASQQAASGNKYLYAYANQTLTRVPHTTTGTLNIAAAGAQSFTLAALSKPLVLTPGSQVQVYLWLQRTGDATNTQRTVYVQLLKNGVQQIGANSAQVSFNTATLTRQLFTITVPSLGGAGSLVAGDTLVLRVQNLTAGANQTVGFGQWVNTGSVVPDRSSLVSLATTTVINVDGIDDFAAAYPATTTRAVHAGNDVVYIRSVVSDPFGGADVSAANLTVTDSDGVVRLANAAMAPVALSGATRTFEYAYTLPAGAVTGVWNLSVTGLEGTEGMVTHTANAPLGVGVADLVLDKSHVGDFTAGQNASYSLVVHNNGVALAGPTTVTDTLPAGLTYVSGTGTGWSCGAVGQDVTCTTNATIAQNADLPTITLTVAVSPTAPTSIDNVAAIANAAVNSGTPLPSNTDTANVLQPDLSTSTKTVVDIDGGDADPGDTLRYTITLVESGGAAATGASVTDNVPAGVSGFSVVSIPPGATNASSGGGANGTGYLNVTGINVAANSSATVVFDVVVGAGRSPGDTIDNTATILAPDGTPTPVVAPTVIVSPSQLAGAGNKLLYLYDTLSLTRTPQAAATTGGVQVAAGTNRSWVLSPVIPTGETLVMSAGTVAVTLAVGTGGSTVDIQAQLYDGATLIGQSTVQTFSVGGVSSRLFTINLGADYTLVAGDALTLRLVNSANGNKNLQVYQFNGGASTISFPTSTVVNVDSVESYVDAWPGTTTRAYYLHGDTVRIRAVASDPFGGTDVSGAQVTITDPDGTVIVNAQAMAVVATGAASRTFEYSFAIPQQADIGAWTATVTAHEGTEGTISDDGAGGFALRGEVVLAATWGAANPGDTVTLAIAGGLDAVAGSSIAPATTTSATAASLASTTLTLSEAFTTGSPSQYTIVLACTRDRDGATVAVSGGGLARTITMPVDSSVTCSWSNVLTTPLTIVKLSSVVSDPVNASTNPKAIPGAIVEYQVILTNPATTPIDDDTVVVTDPVPANTELRVADLGGANSGPVAFLDGAPASGLVYTYGGLSNTGDDVEFSDDNGVTWDYVPDDSGDGYDPAVTDIRINPQGVFAGNNAQFTLRFRVRVE